MKPPQIALTTAVLLMLLGISSVFWANRFQRYEEKGVDSYETCIASSAGRILETYPQRCSINGKVYRDRKVPLGIPAPLPYQQTPQVGNRNSY